MGSPTILSYEICSSQMLDSMSSGPNVGWQVVQVPSQMLMKPYERLTQNVHFGVEWPHRKIKIPTTPCRFWDGSSKICWKWKPLSCCCVSPALYAFMASLQAHIFWKQSGRGSAVQIVQVCMSGLEWLLIFYPICIKVNIPSSTVHIIEVDVIIVEYNMELQPGIQCTT